MSPQEPLKPGEVRISFPPASNLPGSSQQYRYPTYYRHRQHSGSVLGPLICAGILWLIGTIGGSIGGGSHGSYGGGSQTPIGYTVAGSTAASYSGPVFTLPKKPILEGKFAAFIRTQEHRNTDAIVVTHERIQIKVVSSPPDDEPDAITYPPVTTLPDFSTMLQFHNGDEFLLHNRPTQEELSHLLDGTPDLRLPRLSLPLFSRQSMPEVPKIEEQRLAPYVVHGDVIIECGPLVSRNRMVAHLVTQHGGLKAASITIVNGAPRGPPKKDDFANRPVRTIYIVGRVLRVSGPTQRDRSILHASIVDLGPSEKQLDKYIDESIAWHNRVLDTIGNYHVADETLWSERAEHGLILRPVPHSEYNPYHPGGEAYHPVERYEYHPPPHPFEAVP